ncbi:dTMP kinase [Crossiella equi]|uniref:Thymidylate kinase n=1 Tax=Crossiella equi TaxID=130796 RepID=A0ABS5A5N7_9PSEU|nr:AAA family ATPase [Crossiella equi]MBP2471866.1 dTMP kinase [Crossiella equi]
MRGERRFPFIAIEGTDGSGKSTLRDVLNRELARQGHTCFMVGQHSWLDVGAGRVVLAARNQRLGHSREELTRAYALDKFLHLRENIEPALATAGVLADRFVHSDAVYHDVLYGIPAERTLARHRELGTRLPDLVLFVDTDPDIAYQRVLRRNKASRPHETRETLRALREKYLAVLGRERGPVLRVDNSGPAVERTAATVLTQVLPLFRRPEEVRRLA